MTGSGVDVVITGGAGFLGTALASRILAAGFLTVEGETRTVGRLTVLDLQPPPGGAPSDPRVRVLSGDLVELLAELGEPDVIFHLAGVVSGAAEADFDLGMRTNVEALVALLDHCRHGAFRPMVVFTSSLAVFGSDPAPGPIGEVDDDTLPRPQSSYGTQKFIGELLLADYTRKGYVRGRAVRLMTVSVRPGTPNAAASSFLSGIIREPIAGKGSVCPVPADTPVALSSPALTLDGILRAAAADGTAWGSRTAMNLPALTTTPGAMLEALDRVVGPGASAHVSLQEDPVISAIVTSWPARFRTERANRLGLRAAPSFDDIIREYVAGLERSPVAP
ncbi:D-erythronate dehydrogenase [Lysobacter korlensis]|uniref:D-erythronate dehydrogenase n=1 Tax=Lysobacter korlensis TaxID=553636 RepID=A0ABV6RU00_9GAMM